MQIFEITKLGKKRTDEGLLDTFKSAVGISTPDNPLPPKTDDRTMWQKLKGDIPKAVDKNTPEYKKYQQQLDAKTQKLQQHFKDKGYQVGSDLDTAISAVEQNPNTSSAIQNLTQQFDDEFKPGIPDPGTRFVVTNPKNKGIYYKDADGKWTAEDGKVVQGSTVELDNIIDAGGAKQIRAPEPEPVTPVKGQTQPKQKVAESLLQESRKTLAQGALEQFVNPSIKGKDDAGQPISFKDVLEVPEVKTRLTQLFKQMMQANKSNPKNVPGIIKGFKDYVTTAIAGIQIVKKNRNEGIEPDQEEQENPGVATGDPLADKLSQEISPQGLDILERDPEKGLKAIQDILNIKKRKGY